MRYEQAIYEQVKQTSLEAVSRTEELGLAEVKTIFEQQAALSIKKSREPAQTIQSRRV